MVEIAVILMQTETGAKIWLEMATAMMKPTMQNAISMEATVVGPVLIWSNALNVGVWMDPPQIIYVSEMIRRAHTFLIKSFQNI